jgi:hypothetical protein
MIDDTYFYLLYFYNTKYLLSIDGPGIYTLGKVYNELIEKNVRPSEHIVSRSEWEFANLLASLDSIPDELINTLNGRAIFLFNYISDILDSAANWYTGKARFERYTITETPGHPDHTLTPEEEYAQNIICALSVAHTAEPHIRSIQGTTGTIINPSINNECSQAPMVGIIIPIPRIHKDNSKL